MTQQGKFIIFDGGEGSGKSHMSRMAVEHLQGLGLPALLSREPGGSPFAEKIRALILSDDAKHADAETMFALFLAARRDHLMQTIVPALEKGVTVICDRFASSTWAYQIWGQEQGQLRHLFGAMHRHYLAKARPDHWVLFDVPPEVGLKRAKGRGDTVTHFDARDLEFHERVGKGFVEFMSRLPQGEQTTIDASEPVDVVERMVKTLLGRILAK